MKTYNIVYKVKFLFEMSDFGVSRLISKLGVENVHITGEIEGGKKGFYYQEKGHLLKGTCKEEAMQTAQDGMARANGINNWELISVTLEQ